MSQRVAERFGGVPEKETSVVPSIPEISAEELARRRQETGGRSLAEILADLEKRA